MQTPWPQPEWPTPAFAVTSSKGSVAIVFEKMRRRRLSCGKTFEARAVHQKNIQPAVVVVIVESDAATGRFEQIFVFVFAAEKRFDVQAGLFRDVDELSMMPSSLEELVRRNREPVVGDNALVHACACEIARPNSGSRERDHIFKR